MDRVTVYLGLGSNLGCRQENLANCIRNLAIQDATVASKEAFKTGDLILLRSSSIYETEPWGFTGQGPYLNCVLEISTAIPPQRLLDGVKQLETKMGRQPRQQHEERYGPRLIDIDILFYGQETIDVPGLQIPHPRLHQRAFVLVPLAEIAPDVVHPILGLSVHYLSARVDGKDGVKILPGLNSHQSLR